MTELEKIAYAKSFIDKLADGINPLDDKPIPDGDIVNNVRLSRCFFYVSDILRQVIENGGLPKGKKPNKLPFSLSIEARSRYVPTEIPIPVSEIEKRINALIDKDSMKQISYKDITAWLISINALQQQTNITGKVVKRPTDIGYSLGISEETRTGTKGSYSVVVYDGRAQAFILDNIDGITALKNQILSNDTQGGSHD